MPIRRFRLILLFLVLAPTGVQAEEAPVAVSPGSPTGSLIGDACPTFSWSAIPGTKGYELVVYRLGEEGEEAQPLFRQNFVGSVSSWTPSLDSCLELGGQYAWSVRAIGGKEASEWSAPSLFQVASGPSETEFEEAMIVVRKYLAEEETGSVRVSASSGAQRTSSNSLAPQVSDAPAPLSGVAGDSALQVNGAAVLTTATFGAGLCEALTYRYVDQGDGTVLDCNTTLIWLKDASCADLAGTDTNGRGIWDTAQSAAAALSSGTCGLTDGSVAGDWRQPTISEFCSAWEGSTLAPCPAGASSDSLIDSSLPGAPLVTNAAGTGLWSEGDAFVGVQQSNYWSATEFDANIAWSVFLFNGDVFGNSKGANVLVWPVRSGQ